MKKSALLLLTVLGAGAASAADVVVLKGGGKIELKQPPVRRGNTVLLTQKDGTLLSVKASDIDTKATAAAKAAPAAPAAAPAAPSQAGTPAEAAKAWKDGPKARVKLTDEDVGHYMDAGLPTEEPAGEEGGAAAAVNGARVDIANYTQSKADGNLIVKGTLRNLGTVTALNTRLTVTPLDEKEQAIDSAEASVSSGTVEPGREVNFSATIPIGEKTVGTLRFSPRWIAQAPPAEAAAAAASAAGVSPAGSRPAAGTASAAPAAAGAPAAAASKPPAPAPTPYGLGATYAAPPPSAPMERPADGKSGYIPGAAAPEDQPKPPE